MELGRHLGKGLWGIADKALPVAYGLGYVWLVIRVLPEQEFANFVLLQEIFLIVTGLATAIALQPMVKYASEASADTRSIAGTAFILHGSVLAAAAGGTLLVAAPLSGLLNARGLDRLLWYLPAMYAASCVRNFALAVLQTEFRIREIFWIDAVHFLGVPLLVWVVSRLHEFDSAMDMVLINVCTLTLSSLLALRSVVPIFRHPAASMREMRRLWEYGRYSAGGTASYLVYSKADTFLLSAFSGPVAVAVYNSAKVFTRLFEMVTQIAQMFVLPAVSRLSSLGTISSLRAVLEKGICFLTVGGLPFALLFLLFPGDVLSILYGGRYAEAAPLLQIFALLAFTVPLWSVETNALLGLGRARESFLLGVFMLFLSVALYLLLIPLMGTAGPAWGYVGATVVLAFLTMFWTNRTVRITIPGIVGRTRDILGFLRTITTRRTTPGTHGTDQAHRG